MKQCVKCETEKAEDAFYWVKPGEKRDRTCKECRKAMVRANRAKRIDYYREYDKKRGMLPHRVEMRERYQSTEAGKAAIYRGTKKYRQSNPIKMQAHNRVSKALDRGLIERPESCEGCGRGDARLHAHHDDYLRQLDVRWLCPGCHKAWHDEHGEAANSDHAPLPQTHMKTREATCHHSTN